MSRLALAPAVSPADAGRVLRRNLVVSTLGIAARACQLVLLLAIAAAFGPGVLGQFLLGFGLFEIVAAVVAAGFTDGTMLLVSRRAQRAGADGTHQLVPVVATALLVGGGLALAMAALATALLGWPMISLAAPRAALLPGVVWLAWALPPTLIARVSFAATTGLMRLEWEAIVGAAGPPLAMLLALPLLRAGGAGLPGLFATFFAVQVSIAVLALWVLARRLIASGGGRRGRGWRWPRLARLARLAQLDRQLLAFALPQGLNMALTTYIARLDLLMLAALGVPTAIIGGYGSLAAVMLELRQLRMVQSGALGPIVARQHAACDHPAIAATLSRSAAWIASLAIPIALAAALLHADLVALLAPASGADSRFALLLLVGPLVNCLGGLAGNFLVYLLYNRWNLANSLLVALLHTGLCWLLIPRLGLTGAALSGALALTVVTLLENLELAALTGVHLAPRALARAGITLLVGAGLLAAVAPPVRAVAVEARVAVAAAMALLAAVAMRPGRWRALVPRRLGATR
jgi:O-antigen/teichoic acid export membrane protein